MTPKEKALKLRKEGYSYTYISQNTGLSKSTLSYQLHAIPYKPNQKTIRSIGTARVQAGISKSVAKQKTFDEAHARAQTDIGSVTSRDLFMLGLGIYIGEGSKTQDIIRVVNTDYRVIKIFIKWLCAMGYTKNNFTVRVHLYPDSDITASEVYWSIKTGIPRKQFQKACIDIRINKDAKRKNTHKHGTAHVTVRSNGVKELGVVFSRRIGAWMEEVLR